MARPCFELVAALSLCLTAAAAAADFTVNDPGNAPDATLDSLCATAGGQCTLRAAIQEANFTAGADRILFSGAMSIQVPAPLPGIVDRVTIDGTLTPGFVPGTPGVPIVVIENNGTTAHGLDLAAPAASSSVIRGLWVRGFNDPGPAHVGNVALTGAGGVTIAGNYLGAIGSVFPVSETGLLVLSRDNVIGGPGSADRNVICNNGNAGIDLREPGGGNRVIGNHVGLEPDGVSANGNGFGIFVRGSQDDRIGGAAAGERNVISGNLGSAIIVTATAIVATRTLVVGNLIGTDASGQTAVGNTTGVAIAGASGNRIGGTSPAERNVIGGGTGEGVAIGEGASDNVVSGNFIGIDVDGVDRLGNFPGVSILGASSGNVIGGSAPGAGNVISGGLGHGVFINSPANTVQGNYIGTDPSGLVAIPNGLEFGSGDGIIILPGGGAALHDVVIRDNVIAGNVDWGVEIESAEVDEPVATANIVQGNRIGVGADGTTALGNGKGGILLHGRGATDNLIGGSGPGEGNVIGYNGGATGAGVAITDAPGAGDPDSTGNPIRGNAIFANGGLGIDLGGTFDRVFGVYAGDGPDGHQNYPVLTAALTGTPTHVAGTLDSAPSTSFALDFFAGPAPDPSGFGEGALYLGSTTVTTDAAGHAAFDTVVPGTSPPGSYVTATATASSGPDSGNSSELSAPLLGGAPLAAVPTASEWALLLLGGALALLAVRKLGNS